MRELRCVSITNILLSVFCVAVCMVGYFTMVNYPGHGIVYIVFTVLLNALLLSGFTKGRIFFDTFIGIFFWLGFWLKLSLRVSFAGGEFQDPTGAFNGTGGAYDHALLVASCGVSGLLVASLIRRKYLFKYSKVEGRPRQEMIFRFYKNHRLSILTSFFFLFVATAFANVVLGIYQRGCTPRTILPLGLSGVYTWLLLFGLASVSAILLDCEFRLKKNPYAVSIISLIECFFSNVSMLSRGMVLNGGALLLGADENAKRRSINPGVRYKLIILVVFAVLFVSSVFAVNHLRRDLYFSELPSKPTFSLSFVQKSLQSGVSLPGPVLQAIAGIRTLLVDRWVGIEGVMAVSSYSNLGWDLWNRAWQEKYSHSGTSMYDRIFVQDYHSNVDLSKHHFINLPGIVAFFYYPGSFWFLFLAMLCLGFLAAGIEISIYHLSGANIIFCSLIAQVIASRYAHFGYVPSQSYLLFGAIYLNVLIFFFFDRFLYRLDGRPIS